MAITGEMKYVCILGELIGIGNYLRLLITALVVASDTEWYFNEGKINGLFLLICMFGMIICAVCRIGDLYREEDINFWGSEFMIVGLFVCKLYFVYDLKPNQEVTQFEFNLVITIIDCLFHHFCLALYYCFDP